MDSSITSEARTILDRTTMIDDGEVFVAVSESLDGRREIACEVRAEITTVEAMRDLARRIDAAADRLEALG